MVKRLASRSFSSLPLVIGRCFRAIIAVTLLLLLLACQPEGSPQAIFDDYRYRLANSLQADPPEDNQHAISLIAYPTQRELRQVVPPLTVNILAFLRLSQCDLQRLIGQRNSSLGQVMPPTQQLIYDIQFIQYARICLEQLEENSQLYTVVSEALSHKQQYLSVRFWNATFASEEFSHLFSLSAQPLGIEAANTPPQQLYQAVDRLLDDGAYIENNELDNIDIDAIEDIYQVLNSSKYLGEIRLAMSQTVQALHHGDSLIKQRLSEQRLLCFNQRENRQSAIVETVFRQYYIQQVQAYVAKLYQQAEKLLTQLDELLLLVDAPNSYHDFWQQVYRGENSEWQQFQGAIKQHTSHWQLLLQQCGRLPQ